MYSAPIVARRIAETERQFGFRLERYPINDSRAATALIENKRDRKGVLRDLSPDEQLFMQNEILMSRCDFRYFAERYVQVTRDGNATGDKGPMNLWSAQEVLITQLGRVEEEMWEHVAQGRERVDGNCWYVHKARQRGLSSVCQAIGIHRTNFWSDMNGLVASTKDDSTRDLWRMYGYSMYSSLPDWMRMSTKSDTAATGVRFTNGSNMVLQFFEQDSGLGQGFKWHFAHLTECATWAPHDKVVNQVENHFMNAVARNIKGMAFLESTSQGADDWWHTTTEQARRGEFNRWRYFFVPWYMIREISIDYPPEGWEPSAEAKQEAELVARTSHEWCDGATYKVTKEQLYWWERTRQNFVTSQNLGDFYKNHPSTPEQSFMAVDRCSFPIEVIGAAERQTREPIAYYDLVDATYPTEMIRTEQERTPDGRVIVPPPIYRVGKWELAPVRIREFERSRPLGLISMWEPPDQCRPFQTFAGVDATVGVLNWSRFLLGEKKKRENDFAAIQVLRHTALHDVQAAEYCGPVTPKVLARYVDAIGRLYHGQNSVDGQVPLMIELGADGKGCQEELMVEYGWLNFYQHATLGSEGTKLTDKLGWPPDAMSQRIMWIKGKQAIADGRVVIRSLPLVNEMRKCQDDLAFATALARGKAKEGGGRHDDLVYAMMFALWFANDWSNPQPRPALPPTITQSSERRPDPRTLDLLPEERERITAEWESRWTTAAGEGTVYGGQNVRTRISVPRASAVLRADGTVAVTWTNSPGALTFTVFRNGTAIDKLPATDHALVDSPSPGVHVYMVRAASDQSSADSPPAAVSVPTLALA